MNDRPLVLYHAQCWDGFCAAWIASTALPGAECVPVQYGKPPPDVTGRDVLILDFSYKRPIMEDMATKAKSLLCIDHHKSAEQELAGLSYCCFDMSKSGGRMTWEHFHPGEPSPWLVDYSEDRDLWRHQLSHSKEINASLRSYPLDFEEWNRLAKLRPFDLVSEGAAILRAQQQIVDTHVGFARDTIIDGHTVPCVNATALVSEIAGELAKGKPFAVVWFESKDERRVYSLRSDANGLDVSEIAKKYGGGGHARAAGFEVPATGATGIFSQDKIEEEDEGDIAVAIASDPVNKLIRFDFGKKVAWLAIPKSAALDLARIIKEKAYKL